MRDVCCDPVSVPDAMAIRLQGYRWTRSTVGESGSSVYRLSGIANAPNLVLKYGRGVVAADITAEAERLRWLNQRIEAPAVVEFSRTDDEAWLLMSALPGRTAYELLEADASGHTRVVDTLATFLKRLHAIPTADCPFNSDHHVRLAQARGRIDAGLVEEDDFDAERAGWSADDVWSDLQTLLPLATEPVVTHGDFSLDNLIIDDAGTVRCIDVGRAGIADRYQDLAILWNGLGEFGEPLQARLFDRYGLAEPDERRLRFHLLLDELF